MESVGDREYVLEYFIISSDSVARIFLVIRLVISGNLTQKIIARYK